MAILPNLTNNSADMQKILDMIADLVLVDPFSGVTFIVQGDEFTAEEGMTWREFINSDYNTNRIFSIYSNRYVIYKGNFRNRVKYGSSRVAPTDTIIPDATYTIGY